MENSLHYTSVNHAYHLVDSINQLRKQEELCDIILNCGEIKIPAHKLILSVSTPYFKSLVENKYKDSNQGEIRIDGLDGTAVQNIIEFFYTSAVSVDDITVWTLLPAACLLQVEEIQNLCCDFLSSQLQVENCLKVHRVAAKCLCSGLVKETTDFICKNFMQIVDEEAFLDLSVRDVVGHLQRLKEMGVEKDKVLQALKCWVIYSVDDRQMLGYKLLQEFPELKEELENFIPTEYQVQQEDGKITMKTEDEEFSQRIQNSKDIGENLKLRAIKKEPVEKPDIKEEPMSDKDESDIVSALEREITPLLSQRNASFSAETSYCKDMDVTNADNLLTLKEKGAFQLVTHVGQPVLPKYGPVSPASSGQRSKEDRLKYKCSWPDCNKKFFSKTGLKFHTNKHKNTFPYNCELCGKGFNRTCEYEDHMNGHAGYFWKCSICGAVLKSQHGRRVHESQHANQQWPCDICGKLFPCRDYLNSHLRAHVSSFQCEVCKKVFKRKHHYKEHIKVHEKDGFHCKYCDFKTNYAQSLKRHVRNSHDPEKIEMQTCKSCGKIFSRYDHLMKHVEKCCGDDGSAGVWQKHEVKSENQAAENSNEYSSLEQTYMDMLDRTEGVESGSQSQPEFPQFTYSSSEVEQGNRSLNSINMNV